jgi:hypothetical protein
MIPAVAILVISYSSDDLLQVRALVKLLRAGLVGIDRAVFWDDGFEPGEPWFGRSRPPSMKQNNCLSSGAVIRLDPLRCVARSITPCLAKSARSRV